MPPRPAAADTSRDRRRRQTAMRNWKHLLYTAATLAVLALAAGAKYTP
jgi:hypothetical protein